MTGQRISTAAEAEDELVPNYARSKQNYDTMNNNNFKQPPKEPDHS